MKTIAIIEIDGHQGDDLNKLTEFAQAHYYWFPAWDEEAIFSAHDLLGHYNEVYLWDSPNTVALIDRDEKGNLYKKKAIGWVNNDRERI